MIRDRQLSRAGAEKPETIRVPAFAALPSSFQVIQTGERAIKVRRGTRIEIHFDRTTESETAAITLADAAGTYYVWRKFTYASNAWTAWTCDTSPPAEDPAYRVFIQAEITVALVGGVNRITSIVPRRYGDVEVYRRETC